jgi:hypothetical protein
MNTLLEKIQKEYLWEKARKNSLIKYKELIENPKAKITDLEKGVDMSNRHMQPMEQLDFFDLENFALKNKWVEKYPKLRNDYRLYNYLEPIIRFNCGKNITTRGITLPGETWRWEINLFNAFKTIKNSRFEIFGAENSSSFESLSYFYHTSSKINSRPGTNAHTIPYNGDIINLINKNHNIDSLHRNKFVDFIYADLCGCWGMNVAELCYSIFRNKILKQKNGLLFLTLFFSRGPSDPDVREQTIHIGNNMDKWVPPQNQFKIFDSNFACREEKQDKGLMSSSIYPLINGICSFIYRQAQKNEVNLKIYDPHIYYSEYLHINGNMNYNPVASLCFITNN